MQTTDYSGPTDVRERHLILDVLRGLALLGIALANFPEFALWTFLSGSEQAAMHTAEVDKVVRYLQYLLVDGKFYTIFSLLFGIGFGLGMSLGLVYIELTALAVFAVQIICSTLWLCQFRFGPLEWLWRIFTYGRYFPLRQNTTDKCRYQVK